MVEVSTSILNLYDKQLQEVVLNLEIGKTDYIHIDVMDGKFVENDTYKKMLESCTTIKGISNIPLDVHLMCEDIKSSIEDFSFVNPNMITFHYESCKDSKEVKECIDLIKENNARIGIAIKPDTKIEEIYEFMPYIHAVLVMTVEPGKGGQTYLSDMTNKIEKLKAYIDEKNLEIDISADGGINLATFKKVKEAGANIFVAGSSILIAKDFGEIIREFKNS